MPHSPRTEALQYARADTLTPPPEPEEYMRLLPDSVEAETYIVDILKPRKYAALAEAIGEVFEQVAPPAASKLRHWEDMHIRLLRRIKDAGSVVASQKLAAHQNAKKFAEITRTILPSQYIDLETQLDVGAETAAHSITTLLGNVPRLVCFHDPDTPETEFGDIARQGFSLPWRLAMVSIHKMIAARAGLRQEHAPPYFPARLDPREFVLSNHADNHRSLRYRDFMDITVPAGRAIMHGVPSEPYDTRVVDYPDDNGPVIGCPITLLARQLQQLWNEQIELAEQANLWNQSF
jgi:hypothetical protein